MSFFIRTRREELRTLRWTIALTAGVILLLVLAYFSGYDRFYSTLNIVIIAAACACIVFLALLFRRKQKENIKSREVPEKEERPGDWLD